MDNGTAANKRAFFGRRKSRMLRLRQTALFETLLPRLALDLSKPAPADLRTLFPGAVGDVRLEIGFGGGEHLAAEAERTPQSGFIGCDPFINAVAKLLTVIKGNAIGNVRLHCGDASELLAWLPPASIARLDLIYPDPWPKRRHWKRRLVQDDRIVALARVLRPDSEFRFVTDMADYAAWTLMRMARSRDFVWTAERADDWRKPWPDFTSTRYEAKAIRAGRVPCYLIFRRQNTDDWRRNDY